jgi:hypothetical protein
MTSSSPSRATARPGPVLTAGTAMLALALIALIVRPRRAGGRKPRRRNSAARQALIDEMHTRTSR